MKRLAPAFALLFSIAALPTFSTADDAKTPKALAYKMDNLSGKEVDLADYKGKVMLVVNVASQCGLTPQYSDLQKLHEKYASKGLAVTGFPCNQFGAQEPGNSKEIATFCTEEYGVKFDMFAKVDVNGENACDFYKYLTGLDAKPKGAGKVQWNFEKFVIGRNGEVVARFSPRTKPNDPKLLAVLEAELAKK